MKNYRNKGYLIILSLLPALISFSCGAAGNLEGIRLEAIELPEGWLNEVEAWGRPVGLEIFKDGSLLVSDDRAGAVYWISYQPGK